MIKVTLMWQEKEQRIIDVMVLSRLLCIGRSPLCDVVLKHPTISRQHAFVYAFGRKAYVQNTSHTNMIQVGDVLLKENETAEIQTGHILRLGDVVLQVLEVSLVADSDISVTCKVCDQQVDAEQSDCHWCGASLAFAENSVSV